MYSQGISQFYLHTHTFIRNRNEPYLPLPSQPQLVLIYRPRRDGRLSTPWCEVAPAKIQTCNLMIANPALYHTATSAPLLSHLSVVYLTFCLSSLILQGMHHAAWCGFRGCKNRAAMFHGRMSLKATKPGSVYFCLSIVYHWVVTYYGHFLCIVSLSWYVFCLLVVLVKLSVFAK